jgi:hypothetical protein
VTHALANLTAPPARNERRRALEVEIVEPGEAKPSDLEQIAEALGGQETGPGTAALEDSVGRDGGAVDDLADVARRNAGLGRQLSHAVDDRARVVGRRRQHLAGARDPVRRDEDEIGEGAAHIDAEPIAHDALPRPASPRG